MDSFAKYSHNIKKHINTTFLPSDLNKELRI